ncbi:flagellar basal body rod protein FlgC [Seohaeicola saemankumensis]|uniref:flagellar basal body rod protein FlgC n=1 Tax=Seohaeicola TaxID=481178 RepID=UPI0035D0E897
MTDIRNVFDIAGRAMGAQLTRLNTVASNIANAQSVASREEDAFRAIKPIFATQYAANFRNSGISSVNVVGLSEVDIAPKKIFQPDHPKANEDGFIFAAAVNTDEELVEMLEASRQYENNLEVVSTLRSLMARTVNMGR